MVSKKDNRTSYSNDDDVDPCTGFSTTHKAKLSIPTIDCQGWRNLGENEQVTSFNPVNEEAVDKESSHCHKKYKHWIGILFTILSALAFSLTALIAKLLSHLDPFNLGSWTFLLMTLFAGSFVICRWISKQQIPNNLQENKSNSPQHSIYLYLCIRSFLGVSALVLFFYAVKFITVADAIVIDASSPIFVYVLAFIFLGEKLGVVPVLATLLAVFGVTLIARPPLFTSQFDYDWNSLTGAILSFSSMLCIATSIISLKFLKSVSQLEVNLVFGVWGTLQCGLLALIYGELQIPSDLLEISKMVGIAILFFVGQAFITIALKYEDAGPVGLLRTTEVVFVFIWQLVFLGVSPDAYSWCGAFLIIFGAMLILIRNWVGSLPETSDLRNFCNLLLR